MRGGGRQRGLPAAMRWTAWSAPAGVMVVTERWIAWRAAARNVFVSERWDTAPVTVVAVHEWGGFCYNKG